MKFFVHYTESTCIQTSSVEVDAKNERHARLLFYQMEEVGSSATITKVFKAREKSS